MLANLPRLGASVLSACVEERTYLYLFPVITCPRQGLSLGGFLKRAGFACHSERSEESACWLTRDSSRPHSLRSGLKAHSE